MDQEQSEIPIEIRGYIESLLQDAGMTTLDEQMKEEMVKEVYARLDIFIASSIVESLPADYLEDFIKLNEEKKSKEEIENFLKEKMPNYEEVFAKAFADFRSEYLGGVAVSRNTPKTN